MNIKKVIEIQNGIHQLLKKYEDPSFALLIFENKDNPENLIMGSAGSIMDPYLMLDYAFLFFLRLLISHYKAKLDLYNGIFEKNVVNIELREMLEIYIEKFNQIHRLCELDEKDMKKMDYEEIINYITKNRGGKND